MAEEKSEKKEPKKEQPKDKIEIFGHSIESIENGYRVSFSARVISGNRVMVDAQVRVRRDGKVVATKTTDDAGEVELNFIESSESAGKDVTYLVAALAAPMRNLNISFPASSQKKEKKDDEDPEVLSVAVYADDCGRNTLFIRITGAGGKGLKKQSSIRYEHELVRGIKTNANGIARWEFPRNLNPGENVAVNVAVSGIEEVSEVTLSRSQPKITYPFKTWLWRVNNGRAVILLAIMFVLWMYCGYIGLGDPLLMAAQDKPSAMELLRMRDLGITSPPAVEAKSNLSFFFGVFLYSLFAFGYFIASWREEIAAGLREGLQNVLQKNQGRASDPLYERLGRHLKSYSVAHKPVVVQTVGESGSVIEGHTNISTSRWFTIEFLSELFAEFIPPLLGQFFKK